MMGSDRNLRPLSEATQPLYAGVDLGGTSIKAALVDDEGRLVAFHTEPTHAARGPEDAAARMGRMVHTLASLAGVATADIARVGLGSPGPLDIPAGKIVRAGNLPGWDDFPLRDRVSAHCGRGVTFANDANAAGSPAYDRTVAIAPRVVAAVRATSAAAVAAAASSGRVRSR